MDALEVPAVCRRGSKSPRSLAASRAARAYLRPLRDLAVPQQRRRTNRTSGLVSRRAGNLGYLGDVAISAAAAASGAGSERCGHCVNYARTLDRSASAVSADHRWIYFRWLLRDGRLFARSLVRSCGPHHRRKLFAGKFAGLPAH